MRFQQHGTMLTAFFLLAALLETNVYAAPRARRSGESSSNVVKFTKKQKQGVKNNVLASTDRDAFNFQNAFINVAHDIYVANIIIDGKTYEVRPWNLINYMILTFVSNYRWN